MVIEYPRNGFVVQLRIESFEPHVPEGHHNSRSTSKYELAILKSNGFFFFRIAQKRSNVCDHETDIEKTGDATVGNNVGRNLRCF